MNVSNCIINSSIPPPPPSSKTDTNAVVYEDEWNVVWRRFEFGFPVNESVAFRSRRQREKNILSLLLLSRSSTLSLFLSLERTMKKNDRTGN